MPTKYQALIWFATHFTGHCLTSDRSVTSWLCFAPGPNYNTVTDRNQPKSSPLALSEHSRTPSCVESSSVICNSTINESYSCVLRSKCSFIPSTHFQTWPETNTKSHVYPIGLVLARLRKTLGYMLPCLEPLFCSCKVLSGWRLCTDSSSAWTASRTYLP